jgi:glycosyltransferase involved in cell wall biosynthesis
LVASGIPFHWTIAGDGVERGFLERNLKSAGPAQTVSFTGAVKYADVPAVLAQHDIFLLASDYEGLPLSLLEAMGCGLVPVVSDLKSGIPEVVDSINGILVPVDDVAGYARAIIHLHGHRDELAAKSAAARARVEKDFSITAMTDRWLGIIPEGASPQGVWPDQFQVTGPLTAAHPAYFSPLMRTFRRAATTLTSRIRSG